MKTAEEILREVYSPSEPYGSAVVAMEDFAAQEVAKEVEAYKERLKAEIEKWDPKIWSVRKALTIIDTTK